MMPAATRTIKVRFDGTAKGLIAAAAKAGIAVEGFEKQVKKSAATTATSVGGGLIDALGSLPSVLKGAAIVAAAGIGVVMAPALASAIISGTLLAVGGGVLAAGIVGAAKSPKVVKAWQRFGRQAGVIFERFSKPFIKPMERAASTFGRALARMAPTIERIGATIAPVIDKLAPALALLAENALPGIAAAAQASLLIFDQLAVNAPGLGMAVAQFFQAMAAGAPVAAQFFGGFLGWVQDILPKLGGFLTWLSDMGTKMEAFSKGPEIQGLKTAFIDLKDNVLAGVASGFEKIKKAIEENSATWKQLGKDIAGALEWLGPLFNDGVNNTLTGIAAMIFAFAKLYEAVRKVVIIVRELFRGSDKLPSNGGAEWGTIPGRAYGGPVSAGRSYWVGERGVPELFSPRQSGYITPMSDVRAVTPAAAASTFEVHVHVDDPALRDLIRVEIRESNRQTKRRVLAGAGAYA